MTSSLLTQEIAPLAQPQGVLALHLPRTAEFPSRPTLRLVSGDEPELDSFATRFAQAVVEVIGGDRGVHQMIRWTTVEVYDDLQRRCSKLQRTTAPDRRRRRLRAQVRSVHLSRPQDDVAEVSIHVRHGQRSRAIAARIERTEGRWRCTVLEFG
jgi:hypothetical protein